MQSEGKFNSFMSDALARLAFVFAFIFAGNACAFTYVHDETYFKLGLSQLCIPEGQVELTLTNVSGQTLYTEPHIAKQELFDAVHEGMYLIRDDEEYVGLRTKNEYFDTNNWFKWETGKVISHAIDYREYANLDLSRGYMAGAALHIKVINEAGVELVVKLNSAVLDKHVDIEPSCFH